MYRLFLDQHGDEWGELITKETLINSKPWWVVSPQNEYPPPTLTHLLKSTDDQILKVQKIAKCNQFPIRISKK